MRKEFGKVLTVCSTLMGPRVHLAPEPSSFGEQVWWFPRVFLSTWMDLWFTFVPFRSNLKGSKLGPSKLNTKIWPYHKIFLNSPFFVNSIQPYPMLRARNLSRLTTKLTKEWREKALENATSKVRIRDRIRRQKSSSNFCVVISQRGLEDALEEERLFSNLWWHHLSYWKLNDLRDSCNWIGPIPIYAFVCREAKTLL